MSTAVKLPNAVVEAPGVVNKILKVEDIFAVLFESNSPEERNLVAYHADGIMAWRVGLIDGSKSQYYTNIWISPKGELIAGCWAGYDMVVDLKTGSVTHWRDPSWPPDYKPRPW